MSIFMYTCTTINDLHTLLPFSIFSIKGFMPSTETGIVNYVGECGEENYLCKECEGDCDSNKDCKGTDKYIPPY